MTATAARIALRDLRASWSKFTFVVLAVAAGVGALTGVRGFSESFRTMLTTEARTLMAADLFVRVFAHPTPEQEQTIADLVQKRAAVTRVTETLSMVAAASGGTPALTTLKSVDPSIYPLYGELQLQPDMPLRRALNDESVLISDDLALRLGVRAGDTVRVGGEPFRVAAIILSEPDRMAGSFSIGPRLMLSRNALERTGLLGPGSRASQRILFRFPPNREEDVQAAEAELRKNFPGGLVVNHREINPNVARGLDRATTFLSLVSLVALIVGAIGVAASMHAHLQTRMDSIAVMKALGGRSGQILRIYVFETALLGLAGGALGVAAGFGVQYAFPALMQRYLQVQPVVVFPPGAALEGLLLGLLTTLLFTVPPLLQVQQIRPALILRRDMPAEHRTLRGRFVHNARAIGLGAMLAAGLAVLASSLASGSPGEALRLGAAFSGGLAISLLVLAAVASLLLSLLRLVSAKTPGLPVSLRHAVANLYRPASQARAVLTALGVGVMFSLTVYLVQGSVLAEIRRSAPPGMANVFFLDITPAQREGIEHLIRGWKGAAGEPEVISTVTTRILAVNGTPLGDLQPAAPVRRYRMARAISPKAEQPDAVTVIDGAWYTGGTQPGMSVGEGAAKALGLKTGDTLSLTAFGRNVEARVTAIHRSENQRLNGMVEFFISPEALEGLPAVFYAGARVRPDTIAGLQRLAYDRFPTVTVINVADILERVQEVIDQIATLVRFLSVFTLLAGAIILASGVAGTRFRRVRELAIFKTLGATRGRIALMFSAEFLILGAAAGFIGSLLATGFSWFVLRQFFSAAPFHIDAPAVLVSVAMTAAVASAAGWLAIYRVLSEKPLQVLRHE